MRDLGVVCAHYAHNPSYFSALSYALFGSLFIETVKKKYKIDPHKLGRHNNHLRLRNEMIDDWKIPRITLRLRK